MTVKHWPILDLDRDATEPQIRRAYAARLRAQGFEADIGSFQALRDEFEAALAAAKREAPVRGSQENQTSPRPIAVLPPDQQEPRLARERTLDDDASHRSLDEARKCPLDDAPEGLFHDTRDRLRDDSRERLRDTADEGDPERPSPPTGPAQSSTSDREIHRADVDDTARAQQQDVASESSPERAEIAFELDARIAADRCARALEEIRHRLTERDLLGACDRYDLARAAGEIGLGDEAEIELDLAHVWLADTTLTADQALHIARRYRWDDAVSAFALGHRIADKLRALCEPTPIPGVRFIGQWNWGAFCLTPFWLIAHGYVKRGVSLLIAGLILFVVPFGFILMIWVAVDFGRRGNALAVARRTFTSEAQFIAVQNAWRAWGIGIFAGVVSCSLIISILAVFQR